VQLGVSRTMANKKFLSTNVSSFVYFVLIGVTVDVAVPWQHSAKACAAVKFRR
jgi:hypothetical protein